MSKAMDALGKNVRDRAQALDMSQEAVARAMGSSQSTLSKYLTGKATPGVEVVERLAAALRCEPWELLRPAGAQPAPTASSLLGDIVLELVKLDETKLSGILALIRAASRASPIKGKDLDRKGG